MRRGPKRISCRGLAFLFICKPAQLYPALRGRHLMGSSMITTLYLMIVTYAKSSMRRVEQKVKYMKKEFNLQVVCLKEADFVCPTMLDAKTST